MHYLGAKQLTVSTFSRKRHLELSILKSAMLTHLLCFNTPDKVKIENCPFINKYTDNKLLSINTNWFTFSSMSYNYPTSFASTGNLQIPSVETTSYGKMLLSIWL